MNLKFLMMKNQMFLRNLMNLKFLMILKNQMFRMNLSYLMYRWNR
jgi:hypothetical protein